jgi:gliding motility-associated-like protein
MTYNCLGNNQYEILLTIFRDCENGNPGAYFDDPASVGIFSATGAYLRTESFFLQDDDTLDLALNNPCYVIPPDVCIHTTTYRKQITLPFRSGGYHLAYQRCCRNNIIVNINNPGTTGATYDVKITEQALVVCNSSPRFREWPPFFICAGSPINYDNSAFDPDGDSIVYELCSPYIGAGIIDPMPFQPSSPPYTDVTWVFPYGVNNMLGGPLPFAIDPATGLLTGTPGNIGTFVVGICAKEYRNGTLIGTTKRDFQYSVGICDKIIDALFDDNMPVCNRFLTVQHLNLSAPSNLVYSWDFGDGSNPVSASNPLHTYPDTGIYYVQLVAGVGNPCADTIVRLVNVILDAVNVSVPNNIACIGDTVDITAINNLAAYNTITSWNWSPTNAILTGLGSNTIQVLANNILNINLTATNNYGCEATVTTQVDIEFVEAAFDSPSFSCNTSLAIPFQNTSTAASNNYYWDFDGTGTSNSANPTHVFPDSGSYSITLIAGSSASCQDTLVQQLYIPLDGASIQWTGPQLACYGDTVLLSVNNVLGNYNTIPSYNWSPSSFILSGQGTDSVLVVANNSQVFTIDVINENGCTDTIVTPVEILRLNADFDSLALSCNTSLTKSFDNLSLDTTVAFLWDFDGLANSNLVHPSFTFPDTGIYTIRLSAGLGTNCPDTLDRTVAIYLEGALIEASDSSIVCQGDSLLLKAFNQLTAYNSIVNYAWSPVANIIEGQGTDSVLVFASTDMDFRVIGINNYGCTDTAYAPVNVSYLSPAFTVEALPDSIFVGQTSQLQASNFAYSYLWQADTTLSAIDIYDPIARPRIPTIYYVSVSNQNCTLNDSVTVFIKDPVCANPVVFVPSAFSPDNDGYNDLLQVNGNNITEMTFVVYNRWGQKVFETNDQSMAWDGTFKGERLPPDVYGYYMQCLCEEGGSLFLKGNITLLR